jgi:cytosine/adenosine deaminase-related metal-dependent hydrolase
MAGAAGRIEQARRRGAGESPRGSGFASRRRLERPAIRNPMTWPAADVDRPPTASGRPLRIRAGRVLVAAGKAALGPTEIAADSSGRIDAITAIETTDLTPEERRLLLMPALADGHDHGRGLRSLACDVADQPLETWLTELARQPRLDPYTNAAVAFARLAESGVCCVNHCHNTQDGSALLAEAEAVSQAARDVGIRVGFGWPFFDRNPTVYGDIDNLLDRLPEPLRASVAQRAIGMRSCAENFRLIDKAARFEHSLFQLQYHPVAPQWARHDTLAAIARASAETGRRVHVHLLETEAQRAWADREYATGLLPFLDGIGLLSSRLTVAHAVWLRPEECRLLAARGVSVSVNMSSNMRLRSGCPPVETLRACGVNLALGLDGMSLDDDDDMLREMRLLKFGLAQGVRSDPPRDIELALDALWSSGRRSILGEDGGGRIEIGAPADLLALDFARLSADCVADDPDVAALVVGRAQKRHVTDLYVSGRRVVEHGRSARVDLPAIEADLLADARQARAASPPDDRTITQLRDAIAAHYRSAT